MGARCLASCARAACFHHRRRCPRREVLVAEPALERRDGRRRLIQLPVVLVEARRLREKEQRGKS